MAGPQTERWIDHPWGPVFTVAAGAFMLILAWLYGRTYAGVKGREDEAYFRRIRNVHRYFTRPVGWMFVTLGIGIAVWRVVT